MHNLTILPVQTDEQIRKVAELAAVIWHQHFTPIIGKEQVRYMVERFQSYPALLEQMEKQGFSYYLFCLGEETVGYMGVHPEEDTLMLSKLYLLQSNRGQGISSSALRFLQELCREKGYRSIWLTVNRHNDNTIAIYKKMGFSVIREQKSDIGNGFFMDDYVMELPVL